MKNIFLNSFSFFLIVELVVAKILLIQINDHTILQGLVAGLRGVDLGTAIKAATGPGAFIYFMFFWSLFGFFTPVFHYWKIAGFLEDAKTITRNKRLDLVLSGLSLILFIAIASKMIYHPYSNRA